MDEDIACLTPKIQLSFSIKTKMKLSNKSQQINIVIGRKLKVIICTSQSNNLSSFTKITYSLDRH